MAVTQMHHATFQPRQASGVLGRLKLSDIKADIFLGANAMDAVLTYIALQYPHLTEFNSVMRVAMENLGLGPALLTKVLFSVGIVWAMRRLHREYLLVPLAIFFTLVALGNLTLMRLSGIGV